MRTLVALGWGGITLLPGGAVAATLTVGPSGDHATPCAAEAAANPGDVIEIDAAGNYDGDVCIWDVDSLTLRGDNGRPHLRADGNDAGGKGIWVIRGDGYLIENIEFSGAAVPDQNGAGIRQEGRDVTIRHCYFHDNENGILTSHDDQSSIVIEHSEFSGNGIGELGKTHNMYIGHVKSFTLRFSYSHDSVEGHLVKTRAAENHILYNRLSGESGTTSYEIDIPNGGTSYVIGNLIVQSASTHNSALISYRREGAHPANPSDRLYVVNNTFVNERSNGATYIAVDDGISKIVVRNNVFTGPGSVTNQVGFTGEGDNFVGDPGYVDASGFDYHLTVGSPAADTGVEPGTGDGVDLTPTSQYVHPTSGEQRTTVGTIDMGAFELGGGGPPDGTGGTAGGGTTTGGTTGSDGTGGSTTGSGGQSNAGGPSVGSGSRADDEGGCSCRTASRRGTGHGLIGLFAGLGAVFLTPFRRRRA